jgi:hypothetical protein
VCVCVCVEKTQGFAPTNVLTHRPYLSGDRVHED